MLELRSLRQPRELTVELSGDHFSEFITTNIDYVRSNGVLCPIALAIT